MNGDLISRSALLEAFGEEPFVWDGRDREDVQMHNDWLDYTKLVKDAPAVDAVEVVRCKDCKRRGDPDKCPMCYEVPVYQCNGEDSDGELCWDVWEEIEDRTIDDSFCSCGERRADDATD